MVLETVRSKIAFRHLYHIPYSRWNHEMVSSDYKEGNYYCDRDFCWH